MAVILILQSLKKEIRKKFSKQEAQSIAKLMRKIAEQPKKGKALCHVGNIVIKELKYKSFRFYFIADGHRIKFLSEKELIHKLITFVRMSDKDKQQETIEEIKQVLLNIGREGL